MHIIQCMQDISQQGLAAVTWSGVQLEAYGEAIRSKSYGYAQAWHSRGAVNLSSAGIDVQILFQAAIDL